MDGRVLSIQSHVTFGYVGGKAAVFPLQCLGYDVDVVNTVNFSNHTGYGRTAGSRTNAAELAELFRGMEENGLLSPSRLLTGYIPGAEAVKAVLELAKRIRSKNPDTVFFLDPVLGDSGQLYVAPECVPIYRTMLPLATIITPNWFEVEQLTQIKISDLASLRTALRILHREHSVPHVVISSIPVKNISLEGLPAILHPNPDALANGLTEENLLCISSSRNAAESTDDSSSNVSIVHARIIPQIPGYFSGVGDLFSALVLGHFSQPSSKASEDPLTQLQLHSHTPLSYAATQALTKTYAILELTHEYSRSLPEEDRTETDEETDMLQLDRKVRRMRGRELRIIQGQEIIRGTVKLNVKNLMPWSGFWKD